jgi:hypothetical protein
LIPARLDWATANQLARSWFDGGREFVEFALEPFRVPDADGLVTFRHARGSSCFPQRRDGRTR